MKIFANLLRNRSDTMKTYNELESGYEFNGLNIPKHEGNRHYRIMMDEVDRGRAKIVPFDRVASDAAKKDRERKNKLQQDLDSIEVTTARKTFKGSPADQSYMKVAIDLMEEQNLNDVPWVLKNHTSATVRLPQLKTALDLAFSVRNLIIQNDIDTP